MSDEYTDLPNGNAQVEQLDTVETTNACGATLDWKKYNDETVPEWERKDNQQQRKLKHNRNDAKGLQQRALT